MFEIIKEWFAPILVMNIIRGDNVHITVSGMRSSTVGRSHLSSTFTSASPLGRAKEAASLAKASADAFLLRGID